MFFRHLIFFWKWKACPIRVVISCRFFFFSAIGIYFCLSLGGQNYWEHINAVNPFTCKCSTILFDRVMICARWFFASTRYSPYTCLQNNVQDYEPSGTTPVRCEPDVPSKGTIESLRAMPMEALVEEFRENYSYESFDGKELRPSLIPRSPLIQLN